MQNLTNYFSFKSCIFLSKSVIDRGKNYNCTNSKLTEQNPVIYLLHRCYFASYKQNIQGTDSAGSLTVVFTMLTLRCV